MKICYTWLRNCNKYVIIKTQIRNIFIGFQYLENYMRLNVIKSTLVIFACAGMPILPLF